MIENGVEIVIVVVYISPKQSIENFELFIHRTLLEYTEEVFTLLGQNYQELPLILAGEIIVNFAYERSVTENISRYLNKIDS